MRYTFMLLFMPFDFVVVIVENWAFESNNAITGNQILPHSQDLLCVQFCLLNVGGCLCAGDQPEVKN